MNKPTSSPISRRRAMVGAGVAGTAAAAAALLPRAPAVVPAAPVTAKVEETAAGYRESEHVLHYYRTTRV